MRDRYVRLGRKLIQSPVAADASHHHLRSHRIDPLAPQSAARRSRTPPRWSGFIPQRVPGEVPTPPRKGPHFDQAACRTSGSSPRKKPDLTRFCFRPVVIRRASLPGGASKAGTGWIESVPQERHSPCHRTPPDNLTSKAMTAELEVHTPTATAASRSRRRPRKRGQSQSAPLPRPNTLNLTNPSGVPHA